MQKNDTDRFEHKRSSWRNREWHAKEHMDKHFPTWAREIGSNHRAAAQASSMCKMVHNK